MTSDLHSAWARLFVHTLVGAGVRRFVVSPGSRSTPLAIAAARDGRAVVDVVVDERSAGFVALGYARKAGAPAALLCTSGTAGAHYLPALVEASEAAIPLVAITADRPWEAVHTMASQTIDQRGLFGAFVRKSFDLGLPDAAALAHVRRLAAHAVAVATGEHPGPVHVNAAFRKPLEPVVDHEAPYADAVAALLAAPPVSFPSPRLEASPAHVVDLAARVDAADRVVCVFGPSELAAPAAEVRALGRAAAAFGAHTNAILTAEAASGLRNEEAIDHGPAALASAVTASAASGGTTLVVQIGRPPTSPAFERMVEGAGVSLVVVSRVGVPDPSARAQAIHRCDPAALLDGVTRALAPHGRHVAARDRLREAFDVARSRVRAEADRHAGGDAPTEPAVYRALGDVIERGSTLLVGNSLVIRDLDAFATRFPESVLHQRGAAGIDGLFAGAVGARAATPEGEPVIVVLGDVAARHDLGSLALLRDVRAPLVAVVVDNGGGRIFDELPVAGVPGLQDVHERLFRTPSTLRLSEVASAMEIACVRPRSIEALRSALQAALRRPRATLLEIETDPAAGRAARAALLAAARDVASDRGGA